MSDVPVSEAAIGHPDMWSACSRGQLAAGMPPVTAEVALGEALATQGVFLRIVKSHFTDKYLFLFRITTYVHPHRKSTEPPNA